MDTKRKEPSVLFQRLEKIYSPTSQEEFCLEITHEDAGMVSIRVLRGCRPEREENQVLSHKVLCTPSEAVLVATEVFSACSNGYFIEIDPAEFPSDTTFDEEVDEVAFQDILRQLIEAAIPEKVGINQPQPVF